MEIHRYLMVIFFVLFGLSASASEKPKEDISPGEKDYREKAQKLSSFETKAGELEAQFEELVKHKNAAHDKHAALEIIERMKEIKKERDEIVEKFNTVRDEIRFKFPDKGRAVMRRYAPMQKKTVEQLEKRSTLDADLSNAKESADRVYRPFIKKAEEEERQRILQQEETKKAAGSSAETKPGSKIPVIRLEK